MSNLRFILLAEDNPNDAELILRTLSEHHLANQVVTVRDGAEALDYLYQRGQFAHRAGGLPLVVFLDVKMPKVDGIEVLRQIKADPVLRRVPVVIVTSSRQDQDLVKCYELGVNAYVVKPVDFQHFADSINSLGYFWGIINEPSPAFGNEGESNAV